MAGPQGLCSLWTSTTHHGARTFSTLRRGKPPVNPKLDGAVLHLQSYVYVVKGDVDLKVFLSTLAVSVSGVGRDLVSGLGHSPCFHCHIVIGRRRRKWNVSSGLFSRGDNVLLSLFQLKCHCCFSLFSQDNFSTVIILIVPLWVPPNPSSWNSGSHE